MYHSLQPLPLTEGRHMLLAARQFITDVKTAKTAFCLNSQHEGLKTGANIYWGGGLRCPREAQEVLQRSERLTT